MSGNNGNGRHPEAVGNLTRTRLYVLDLEDPRQRREARDCVPSYAEHRRTSRALGARIYWRYLMDNEGAVETRDENDVSGLSRYKILGLPRLPDWHLEDMWTNPEEVKIGYKEFRHQLALRRRGGIDDIEIEKIIRAIAIIDDNQIKGTVDGNKSPTECGSS